MATYTVFCTELNGSGTTWIDRVEADGHEVAAERGRDQCAQDWNCDESAVHVLGVLEGEPRVCFWEDPNES